MVHPLCLVIPTQAAVVPRESLLLLPAATAARTDRTSLEIAAGPKKMVLRARNAGPRGCVGGIAEWMAS